MTLRSAGPAAEREQAVAVAEPAIAAGLEAAGLPYAPIVRPDQLVDDRHLIDSGGLGPDVGLTLRLLSAMAARLAA